MNEPDTRPSSGIESLISDIAELATQYDAVRLLKKITESYGLRAFLVLKMPGSLPQGIQSISVVSSMPAELVTRYDQSLPMATSPVFNRLRISTLPFAVDLEEQMEGREGRDADARDLFKAYRMQRFI